MIEQCPACKNTNIDRQRGRCNNCNAEFDPEPAPAPAPPPLALAPPAVEAADGRLEALTESSKRIEEATSKEEEDAAWQSWESAIFKFYDDGFKIITLIGFSEAGKTFFVNRLIRELRLSDDWKCKPEEATKIQKTQETIQYTQMIHHGREPRRYLLTDCDGEAFSVALGELLQGNEIKGSDLRRYVLMTALASAYFLVIPAATVVTGGDIHRTERLIDRFDLIIDAAVTLQSARRKGANVRHLVQGGLTKETMDSAFKEGYRCDQPIHVLFAQADLVKGSSLHDSDPYVYAMRLVPVLFRIIEKHFKTHRFDFVSAFVGHEARDDHQVDYSCAAHGTLTAFDWLDKMVHNNWPWTISTSAARWARRFLDPAYRRQRKIMRGGR